MYVLHQYVTYFMVLASVISAGAVPKHHPSVKPYPREQIRDALSQVNTGNRGEKVQALEKLLKIRFRLGDEAADTTKALKNELSSHDRKVRLYAAGIVLGAAVSARGKDTQVLKPVEAQLRALLADDDKEISITAIVALSQLHHPSEKTISSIIKVSKQPDLELKRTAFQAMGKFLDGRYRLTLKVLTSSIRGKKGKLDLIFMLHAIEAMSKVSNQTLSTVASLLANPEKDIRRSALSVIDSHSNKALTIAGLPQKLLSLWKSNKENKSVRLADVSLITKLMKKGNKDAADALDQVVLEQAAPLELRLAAMNGIAMSASEKFARSRLLKYKNIDNDRVRQQAAAYLNKIETVNENARIEKRSRESN